MAASFKDRYEELFGKTPAYDPINIDAPDSNVAPRRAINIQKAAPEIDAGGAFQPSELAPAVQPPADQGVMGNLADITKTGTAMLGEAAIGVGEYALRQAARTDIEPLSNVFQTGAEGLESGRNFLADYRQKVYDSMPQDAVAKKGAEFMTLDPDKTIWKGNPLDVGEAILYKFWESLPMMAATLIPGAVMMRAGAAAKGLTYLGASEGGLSVGFIANEITDGIQEMDDATLAKESPRFAELLEINDPVAARQQLIAEAQGMAPVIGGALVGAISYSAGRFLEPIITGKGNFGLGQRVARGAASEGLAQEGPQESVEQITSNIARAVYDGDLDALDGVMESFVQGAVVGAPGGALVGGVAGRSSEPAPPGSTEPVDNDRPDAPSSFDDVFTEQTPPAGGYTGAPGGDLFGDDPNLFRDDPNKPAMFNKEGEYVSQFDVPVLNAEGEYVSQLDPAVAAAVSVAIRGDGMMDDMIDNSQSYDPNQQNLDLQAGGMNSTSREVATAPQPPAPEGTQGTLPLQQKQAGVPPQDVSGSPPVAPVEQPVTQGAVPTEQQGDMFNPVPQGDPNVAPAAPLPAPAGGPTQTERGSTTTDGFTVTMTAESGEVMDEEVFNTADEAEVYSDMLHEEFPDHNINVRAMKGPRVGTPRGEAVAQEPEAQPDIPSAEPMGDIQAQLRDLENPESDREGVFLSADNLARLQRDDQRENIGDIGVHLVNFDGKGGLLIAQDQEIADSVTELRDNGFPMQMILGQVTQNGYGKPPAEGSAVVQLRDADGNVVRESLQSEEDAYRLSDEMGDMAVVLTPQQAQKRRETLIAQEEETARQNRVIRDEVPMEDRGEVQAAVTEGRTPKTASKAAANVMGTAVKRGKAEREVAIGGFFPPNMLEFKSSANEKAYRDLWNQLVENQLQLETAGTYPINRKADLKKEGLGIFDKLGKVRQLEKPTRKTARVMKAAAGIDRGTVAAEQRAAQHRAEEIDSSDRDYFAGESFEKMTRAEIKALSDTELTTAFASAAYWLSGQFRNVQITPEWLAENFEAAKDRDFIESIREAKGDPFVALSREYSTPGMQRKLLRRASNMVGQLGTKVRTLPVTIKGTKGEVDPAVMTRDKAPQDESKSDEIKRKQRATNSRKTLSIAVKQSGKLIMRLENPRSSFGKAYAEVDSAIAQKARTAKAYFVSLNQLAMAMIESGSQSNESIAAMDKLNDRLRELVKLTPAQFANNVSTMARADEFKSLSAISSEPKVKLIARSRKRVSSIEGYHDNLRRALAARDRLHEAWEKNAYYNNLVGPLMIKFTDSIAVDGWASYRPNEAEMAYLEHAMHGWRTGDEHVRKNFYDPLKKFFRGVGMEFEVEKKKGAGGDLIIPKDEDGNYRWSSNDQALHQKLRSSTTAQMAGDKAVVFTPPEALKPDTFNKSREDIITYTSNEFGERIITGKITQAEQLQYDEQRRDREADAEQAQHENKVNRAIVAFQKIVNNPKSTIQKLVKAEQALIKRLKEAGVWEDTPSPAMGKIRVGSVKTYRKVGLPLLQKKISKQQARETMMKLKPYKSAFVTPVKFTQTQAEKVLELKMSMVDPQGNADEFQAAATAVGDLIVDRTANTDMNMVLDAMLKYLPQNHIYRTLASKLRQLNIQGVAVKYDFDGKLIDTELGAFSTRAGKRWITLNNRALIKERIDGNRVDARAIHVLLHEMVHAATHRALALNPQLSTLMMNLRRETIQAHDNSATTYGLQDAYDSEGNLIADEFVAEAMSNPEFQAQLRKIILNGKSVWTRFLEVVRSALGFANDAPISVMDVIVSAEADLFSLAAVQTPGSEITMAMRDGAAAPIVSQVIDRVSDTAATMKRIWSMPNPPLVAMTMEQIRDVYFKYLGQPLKHYMDSFFQRNARNTELMAQAEVLTRQWTKLNEEAGTEGEAFSTLATEATLNEVAANVPLSHEANKHLTSSDQKAQHRKLHKEFNAMSTEYKKLYNDLQAFYRETLERESALMTLNALRGLLTKGDDKAMSKAEFNKKYDVDKLSKFDDKKKMTAEFGEYFDTDRRKDMMSTLTQMANMRQQRRGNYFPIKRYGNYVVSAERVVQQKTFEDRREAFGFAAERRATDATLVVNTQPKDGGWTVTVIEKEFSAAESPTRAEELRQSMIEEYGGDNVTPVQRKTPKQKSTVIESNQALNSILATLKDNKAAQAAIKQFYLDSLSDTSFRKHEMRRKNRRGADSTLQLRNFTVYAKQSAYYTAQLEFGHKMADSIQEMNEYIREHRDESDISAVRLGEVRDEIVTRDDMQVDPDEILNVVRKSVEYTQFAMLTSPSYWMINASQPWMVTLPWLASKYGYRRSLAALKNAQGLIISPLVTAAKDSKGGLSALRSKVAAENAFNVLDDVLENIDKRDPDNAAEYRVMLEELRRNNIIDLSWIAELRDISEGTNTGKWQKLLDASRIMAHLTEVNNRILTAVATYDLAKQEAIDKNLAPDTQIAYATKMAQLAVSETQFNYSSPNKPRLFQAGGPLGKFSPMVFQFMQWPQHMYAMMIKNMHQSVKGGTDAEKKQARKLLLGLFGTHLAAGGVLGAALQPIKWAIGLTMFMFGDDDDTFANAVSGESFDRAATQGLVSTFGSEIGGVLAKGLPTALGADLSQRMSLGTVYFIDFKSENAESALGSLALGLGGASVNLVANTWRGLQDIAEGNIVRGIERGSPKILRDVIRTNRYWREGLVNAAGDTVISTEGLGFRDLFLQSMGIQPFTVSQFYQGQQAIKDKERYYRDRKSDILKSFRTATAPGDRAEVLRNVADFNRNNPGIPITRSALIQSVTGKYEREARYRRYGANIDDRAATQFASEGDPYK